MTPKEKAKELVDRYYNLRAYETMSLNGKRVAYSLAKQCALIACDFSMEVMIENLVPIEIDELKQEIQKL